MQGRCAPQFYLHNHDDPEANVIINASESNFRSHRANVRFMKGCKYFIFGGICFAPKQIWLLGQLFDVLFIQIDKFHSFVLCGGTP